MYSGVHTYFAGFRNCKVYNKSSVANVAKQFDVNLLPYAFFKINYYQDPFKSNKRGNEWY
jgi:hypothetical protein